MRGAGQEVSAQLGGHVSSSTLSAHQMARAGEPLEARAVLASAVFFLVQFVVGDMGWCGFFWLLGGECGGGSAVFSLVPLPQRRAEQVRIVLRLWTSL